MTTTTPTATVGECLICGRITDLLPGGPIADHHAYDTESGMDLPCAGAGHTRVHGDDRDTVRREAVRAYAKIQAQITTRRAELTGDMAKGWRLRDVIGMDGCAVLRMEAHASHWRGLAVHGDWWEATRKAVETARRYAVASDPMDRALQEIESQGAREWLSASNITLQLLADELGEPGRPLLNILRSL